MQNLPVSASAMPSPVNVVAAAAVPDTASVSAPDSQDFSAVLARKLFAKTIKLKPDSGSPDAATSDSRPYQPESEMAPLQIPSDLGPIAPALLALAPGTLPIQPEEHSSGHQRSIQGKALPAALATEPSAPRNFPQAALPDRPAWETENTAEIAAPGSPPPDEHSSEHQRSIPGKALPAALAAETSAPRNFPQATLPDRPALESGNMPEIAAPGSFLPPVAAEEKTPHSGTGERVTQRLSDGAPLPQMTNPLSPAAASLAPASAAATRDLKLDTRVGAPGWSGELAQKVVWMATQQQQTAELHLNPPHLGPVEVMLTIGNDQGNQASIQFASPHLAAREAIETALPRLREMMADSGIALGNVTVSADSFQQNAEAGRQRHSMMKPPADITETGAMLAARPTVTLVRDGHNRLVDTFA